jgi:hypothetical protein
LLTDSFQKCGENFGSRAAIASGDFNDLLKLLGHKEE